MIQCNICQHRCNVPTGGVGRCRVIRNSSYGSSENSLLYEYVGFSNISVDHIEKRPFFHFMPGAKCLSVGFYGCSFTCGFCQNYRVSQECAGLVQKANVSAIAKSTNVDAIAFTYNEPTIYYKPIQTIAQEADKPIVVKTNGYATEETWDELLPVVAAYNVDIKGTDQEYREHGGSLMPVMQSIEYLWRLQTQHLEISYLVSASNLGNMVFHATMADWIASLSRCIPVHILMTYPCHREQNSYDPRKLIPIFELFKEQLNFVYISNIFSSDFSSYRNTHCPICHRVMVTRHVETKITDLECCGQRIAFIGGV